ncbi:putative late blight resistance protein homolog R1A-4 [Ipomoea triloba]|uniref:putative late blight resistance protein homolog R1A-4 n=1 Tax=Ipomoea triloba TaxID=35885 RepID=UPI00125D06D5|nr:putative late blight resistance protein homolog R1A-4 [Ipomoea triloba]
MSSPSIGMGGIGKTTLAKKIYEDECIKSHFNIRAWITVSQSYSLDDLLQMLLLQSNEASSQTEGQSAGTSQLKDKVRKWLLTSERYLIAIDDIWSTQVWDNLQTCFPLERNESRVLLTTRLTYVATYASSGGLPFSMSTLSKEESWDLFCKKVFAKESCLPSIEFEKIGRDIVIKCKGLPLSIMVIAGILSKAEMKVEDWKYVAKDVVALSSTLYEEQNCEKILLLSYNHLPENLKTCFLYLGVFPEDYEISVTSLVGYWVADKFVEDEALVANNHEEVAWQKLQDLIDRNLILVEKRGRTGRIKTCKIHDLTREMCLRLAKGKNILYVIYDKFQIGEEEENGNFWVSLQSNPEYYPHSSPYFDCKTLQKCHSFLAIFPFKYRSRSHRGSQILTNYLLTATSIQVLDLLPLYFPYLSKSFSGNNLSQLRYLALYIGNFQRFYLILSNLKNLQTLILQTAQVDYVAYLTLPETPPLRQIRILNGSFHFKDDEENLILKNLTTLLWLSDFCCKNEALMVRIPNLKKLGIKYEDSKYSESKHPIDLGHLEQLEHIKFYGYGSKKKNWLVNIPQPYDFPPKLKKLKFSKTWMKLEIMTILGSLPNLETLQLDYGAFDDSETEWELVEEGFSKLKVLVFNDQTLCRWIDCYFSFPRLECLVLKSCPSLESLPYECLSGCPCLKLIDLEGCYSDGVLESAIKIREELGDGQLKVHPESCCSDESDGDAKLEELKLLVRRLQSDELS